MSVSYRALTIIGCEIDLRDLYVTHELYADDHGCEALQEMLARGEQPGFCPTCGEELRSSERDCLVPEFEESYEDERTIGGLPVVTAVDGQAFLAAYVQENGQDGSGGVTFDQEPVLDSFHMAARLKTILEPLDMWDVKEFGIYTILDVSH
jgi:hypothetical protein